MPPHWPLLWLVRGVSLPFQGKGWGWGLKDFAINNLLNNYQKRFQNTKKKPLWNKNGQSTVKQQTF
ncbi:MAG: hypothetical protein B6D64_13430 [Bacteroidetes bacterium 4484_276]|nr:MAG: hypothetical protein B6D64_13430 [Bacteroidetes bacterium 4484_276]